MKKFMMLVVLALAAVAVIATGPLNWTDPTATVPVAAKSVIPLSGFVGQVMKVCKAQLSEARKSILVDQLVRISEKEFPERNHQEAFISLVCIESRFNAGAKSSAGAVGLSQLMPKYSQDFANACNLGKINAQDLYDSEVNLRVGACHFNKLLRTYEGNIVLALAAYNAGAGSPTIISLQDLELSNVHTETAGYITKFATLQEKLRVP